MICASFWLAAAFCATRLLYHIRFDLSRGFWKVFSKFSAVLSNRTVDSSCRSARLLYHIFLILSRGFSKVFSTFFVILRRGSSFRKRPTIISHHLSFVKRFCKSFSTFFVMLSGFLAVTRSAYFASLVVSLHIIALSPSFVKGFFLTFLPLVPSAFCHNFVVGRLCMLTKRRPFFARFQKKRPAGKAPAGLKASYNQMVGISSSISRPSLEDFAIPSRIAWL